MTAVAATQSELVLNDTDPLNKNCALQIKNGRLMSLLRGKVVIVVRKRRSSFLFPTVLMTRRAYSPHACYPYHVLLSPIGPLGG